jgi:hypothetical protein
MTIVELPVIISTLLLVFGILLGVTFALVLLHRKRFKELRFFSLNNKVHILAKIRELSEEKAEILANKKALKDSYKSKAIGKETYISMDGAYSKRLHSIEEDTKLLIEKLAALLYAPEERRKATADIEDLINFIELREEYNETKMENTLLKTENDRMRGDLARLEREKDSLDTELQAMRKHTDSKLKEMKRELEEERKRKTKPGTGEKPPPPKPSPITEPLRRENGILRETLQKTKERRDLLAKELSVLKAIFNRHTELIDEAEKKTALQLKTLVKPGNEAVKDTLSSLGIPLGGPLTESSTEKLYTFVRDEIKHVPHDVNVAFWLKPEEILELKAADTEDKAILLCSLLRAAGSEDAKVIVFDLEQGANRAVVFLEFEGRFYLLDTADHRKFGDFIAKTREDAIEKYHFDRQRVKAVLYEFNDRVYEG